MISAVMQKMLKNNSVIRTMFEEGNRLSKLYGRENVYDFSLGNPNMPAPEEINAAIRDILDEEDPVLVHGYMSNAGFVDVREKLAKSLNEKFGQNYSAKDFIMTAGAAMAINILFKSILNPEDEVIVFAPYFVEYGNYAANYGARLVVIDADTRTFFPNIELLGKRISLRTKAVIINSPNNPTGVIYPKEVLEDLHRMISKKEQELGITILTVSDEPYRELVYGDQQVPWVPDYIEHAVVVYSYSKSFSLAGERIGWLLVPENIPHSEEILAAATIVNRCMGSVNAPSLIQRAVARCLDVKVDIEFYAENRKILSEGLRNAGFDVVASEGAFYLFLKSPEEDDRAFCAVCKEQNILLVPGSAFACAGYVRISYCVSKEMIERSLPAFGRVAEHYGLKKD